VPQLDIEDISRQYFARIRRAALVLCGNPWDADDLAQETFLVVAKQAGRFQGRSAVYTWLYGILLNLDRRRRRRSGMQRKKFQVVWEDGRTHDQTIPAAETPIEVSEWKRSLWAVVSKLPDGQRQALVLRFSESLRYEEIAEVLGCPLGTVKSRIHHGLASLRELMKQEGAELRRMPAHPCEDVNHAV